MNILATLRSMTGMNLAHGTVEQAVRRRMEATGQRQREAYADTLGEAELRELVELVVVPESWLFRDPQAFAAAVESVRARLAGGAAMVRILCVPCAGGEEPYSMAMALYDAGVVPRSFMIDAVDISAACIARAEAGVFGRNAFRAADLSFRDRYFTPTADGSYRIDDELRGRIRFAQGNLLEGPLGSARRYDVIFCRNLLIYFDEPTTAAAIERLSSHLADDGMLLAGYAEVPSFVRHSFAPLPHRQAFALRKDIKRPGAPARSALPTLPAQATLPVRSGPLAPTVQPLPSAPPAPIAAAASAPSGASAMGEETLLQHARILADAGRLVEADSACREFLAQQPESAEAHFILGLLAESAGNPAEAETQLKRCLYLQPDHYDALCHLALLQEQGGNSRAAATLKARAARAFQRQRPQ